MSRPRSESEEHETIELDRFSDAFMEYLFEHGHLSKSFRPWWQARKRAIAVQPPMQAARAIRSICKDHLEMTKHWSAPDVDALDHHLESSGAMTLTMLRRRIWQSPSPPSSPIVGHHRPSPY